MVKFIFLMACLSGALSHAEEGTELILDKQTIPNSYICHPKESDKSCKGKVSRSDCTIYNDPGLCVQHDISNGMPVCRCLMLAHPY